MVNSHLVCDPTIRQPGFDVPRQQWSAEPFSHGTGTLRCLQKEMTTYRHCFVSLWWGPNDVPHCRILRRRRTRSCRPLADWCSIAIEFADKSIHSGAGPCLCPRCFVSCEKLYPPRKICASGGGLLMAPIYVPRLLWRRLMQGWLFVNDDEFWQPAQAEALLTSVPLVSD